MKKVSKNAIQAVTQSYFGYYDRRTLTENERDILRCADEMAEELLGHKEKLDRLLGQHKIRVKLEDDCELPGWAVHIINGNF